MNTTLKPGCKVPDFTASSTQGLIKLSDYAGKWVVLFCSPGEFNLMHRNDWILFIKHHKEFTRNDTALIGISMDKNATHLQWLYSVYRSNINTMPFPIIDDRKGTVSQVLEIDNPPASTRSTGIHLLIIAPDQTLMDIKTYASPQSLQMGEVFKTLEHLKSTYRTQIQGLENQPSGSNPFCDIVPIVGEYVLGNPVNVDPLLLDFVIYAFALINPDGTFEPYSVRYLEELADLRSSNPDLKVLMAIGGWGAEGFSDAASTPASRYAFAREAKRWVDTYNLDGIDLDWEYPGSSIAGIKSSPADRENFTLLITALRDVLGPNKWITVAGTGDSSYINNVEISRIAPLINYFNLMAYDFNAGETGPSAATHQANLYPSELALSGRSVDAQIRNLIAAGMPSNKILMGLPFYGRYGATRTITFDDLRQDYINQNGYTARWDDTAKASYIVDSNGNFVYSYDDLRSIYYKAIYVRENCLGGLFSWQSGMDRANILAKGMSDGIRDINNLVEVLETEYSFTP
ncbi:MAG: glycoside hydrolase family 18 [Clostridia bacterium]|nr:glycoside hydrolase family 18 [Clostridia bacterium]